MQTTTFEAYKQARKLQEQAHRLEERLELLSRYGVERSQALSDAAWERSMRRMHSVQEAADLHWGVS